MYLTNTASLDFITGSTNLAGYVRASSFTTTDVYMSNTNTAGWKEMLLAGNNSNWSTNYNTTNISYEYVEGEAILLMMNEFGICASSGSACTSGSLEPSHVLRAMGVPFTAAHGSIRYSLSDYNTEEEIDTIIEHTPPIIKRLRELSPFWSQRKAS